MHASTMKIQPEVRVVKSRPCRTHMQHMKSTCRAVGATKLGRGPGAYATAGNVCAMATSYMRTYAQHR